MHCDIVCREYQVPWTVINQFRSKDICFHFLFINFMVFTEGDR